jgi:hypothetical protein
MTGLSLSLGFERGVQIDDEIVGSGVFRGVEVGLERRHRAQAPAASREPLAEQPGVAGVEARV